MPGSPKHIVGLFLLCGSAAFCSFAQSPPLALDPSRNFAQYTIKSWQKKDGLAQNSVGDIIQSREGFLWLATQEGLVRFDGTSFKTFTPRNSALTNKLVTAILERSDGTLWIGTEQGGVAVMASGSIRRHYTIDDGLRHNWITSLYEDSEKNLWIGTLRGLCVMKDSVFRSLGEAMRITDIAEWKAGELVVGSVWGLYSVIGDELVSVPIGEKDWYWVTDLYADRGDTLWVATQDRGLYRVTKQSGIRQYLMKDGLPSNKVRSVIRTQGGVVWVGMEGKGLVRIWRGAVEVAAGDPVLSTSGILSLIEDMEGNLWIGAEESGLFRVSNGKFTSFPLGNGSSQNFAWAVKLDSRGNLWAANAAGQILRWDGRQFAVVYDFLLTGRITSIYPDRSGKLWVVKEGFLHEVENGRSRKVPGIQAVIASYLDRADNLWIGTRSGLVKIRNGRVVKRFGWELGLDGSLINLIREDRSGTLWVATDRRVHRLRNGLFDTLAIPSRKPVLVSSFHEDPQGIVWLGTIGSGLMIVRDTSVSFTGPADGLYDENVYSIQEDRHGNFWMSCNNGVFRVSRQNLLDYADHRIPLEVQVYNESDGMKNSECNGGAWTGCTTRDGKIWFATVAGVAMVDPERLPVNSLPPPVVIDAMTVDRQTVDTRSRVILRAGSQDLQFDYAALSLAVPEKVRYRYRIVGRDKDWIEAGTRKFAVYSNLQPGRYLFEVIGSNNDGVWNVAGASLEFTLEPFFYETSWFAGLCVLVAILTVGRGLLSYQRYQQKKVRASEIQAQLAKAQLQTLRMQLQPHFLFNTLNGIMVLIKRDPETARGMVGHLSDLLRLTLDHQERQEVPLRRELEILDKYLQIEMTRFRERLTIDIEVSPQAMEASVPTFILQPLVENSIKHGLSKIPGPTSIRISGMKRRNMLFLSVRDNGAGLTGRKHASHREGIGLSNTRARLTQMYGTKGSLELKNGNQAGVEVIITIPYRKCKEEAGT